MRRCVIPLLIVFGARVLCAQTGDSVVPPPAAGAAPSLQLASDPADSGFARWRRTPLPRHDDKPAAWTLRAGEWDFLIATPRAMDAMDTSRVVDRTLESCARPLHIADDDVKHVAAARPWAPFDALVTGIPVMVISIMPVLQNLNECDSGNLGRPSMLRRGVRFVTNYIYDPTRDARSAVLVSRRRVVRPVMLARAPVIVMSRTLMSSTGTDQLRLYIPYDAIAPDSTGALPETELQIWPKGGGPPTTIPLPADIIHAVWWDYLRWRAARLATRSGTEATNTLERLAGSKLSINDRRTALRSLADTFRAGDDSRAAALATHELATIDPCAPGNAAPPGIRCTALPAGTALVRGVIPGYGLYSTWSRAAGIMAATLTVGGAVTALTLKSTANTSYAKYLDGRNGNVVNYRLDASRDQQLARSAALMTAGFWLATAIGGEIHERVHAARVAAERDFWVQVAPPVNRIGGMGFAAVGRVPFR